MSPSRYHDNYGNTQRVSQTLRICTRYALPRGNKRQVLVSKKGSDRTLPTFTYDGVLESVYTRALKQQGIEFSPEDEDAGDVRVLVLQSH